MSKIYDLLIIGGGIAGITAAIYAARKEMDFAIISPELGGEIVNTTYVENWPGIKSTTGKDLADSYVDHMKSLNVEIIEDSVMLVKHENDLFIVTTYGGAYEAKTLIWATGSKYKSLNISGEEEMKGRGVTYCSICDGPLYKNKTVAIIGSGNNALTSAIYMAAIAKKVYLVNRTERIRGDQILFEKLKTFSNVEVLHNSKPKKVIGEKKVASLLLDIKDEEKSLDVDGVIINVGYTPITEALKGVVELDNTGYLSTDAKKMTSTPGLFAAGDVVNNPYKQLVISASDGAIAALGAYDYLSSKK